MDGRPKPSFSVKERGSNGASALFAIFCLKSFDEDSVIVKILFRVFRDHGRLISTAIAPQCLLAPANDWFCDGVPSKYVPAVPLPPCT